MVALTHDVATTPELRSLASASHSLALPEHIGTRANTSPFATVIVPTRNEAGNVPLLLQRLYPVLDRWPAEIIFVDDSDDDTPNIIRHESRASPLPVRLIHRNREEASGGLGGAVVAGMRAARGTWVVIMDGDLQHPPEVIPDLLREGIRSSRNMVIANRYCEGGSAGSFSFLRLCMSKGSTLAAKTFFPRRMRNVDDPMTGFFLVRRDALNIDDLHPNGFKILVEIVARTPNLRVGSVPFVFGERHAGTSKASLREGLRFLELLCTLRFGTSFTRFTSFSAVGISGLAVNTILLAFWTDMVGLYYMLSLVLAAQGSSIWNFLFSEHLVFRSIHRREGEVGRAAKFLIMNNIALLARGPIVFGLTSMLGVHYLVSNVLSMAVLLIVRYVLADSFIWKPRQAAKPLLPCLAPSDLSTVTGQPHHREASS
jgi:dolichol-phosphate mannosyltransferase